MPRASTKGLAFSKISPAVPSVAYDTFWRFAVERQNIFFGRALGMPPPWTADPILSAHKFTNAYRASDRVSQYLIRHVIGTDDREPADALFRIVLFKLFNKIETWELLESSFGDVSWTTYRYSDYERVLGKALESGQRIYSAAYIMASGGKFFDVPRKHQAHLQLLEMMLEESLHEKLTESRKMSEGFALFRAYPLIGDFLAYQLVTDVNYSALTDYSEMEFTMPGPGARDGIKKCFHSLGGVDESDVIRIMADRQDLEFERLGLSFKSLWGRPLQLIDIQNLFCEVDKYSRVRHPELNGHSGRTRIKQIFRATESPIQYQYPTKWNLNVSQVDRKMLAPAQCSLF